MVSGVDMIYRAYPKDLAGMIMEYYVSSNKNLTRKRYKQVMKQMRFFTRTRSFYREYSYIYGVELPTQCKITSISQPISDVVKNIHHRWKSFLEGRCSLPSINFGCMYV